MFSPARLTLIPSAHSVRRLVFQSALLLPTVLFSSCFFFEFSPSHAHRAEEFAQEKNYAQAIKQYEFHIQARLHNPNRPEEENPYFYYLLIGDLFLKLNDFSNAKASYVKAKNAQVSSELVNERLRGLSRYLEGQGNYEGAIQLLQEFRNLDPMFFDLEIDQVHKQMIQSEEEQEKAK